MSIYILNISKIHFLHKNKHVNTAYVTFALKDAKKVKILEFKMKSFF